MPEVDTAVDMTARPSTTPRHPGDDGRPVATADVGAERVRSGFHPEIQGLRAVAVLLVVLFHLWPNACPVDSSVWMSSSSSPAI